MTDLEAIRERSRRCEEYRDDPKDRIDKWALAAVASAADVPALIAAVESLRIQRDNAEVEENRFYEKAQELTAELVDARAEARRLRGQLADANRTIQALAGGAK